MKNDKVLRIVLEGKDKEAVEEMVDDLNASDDFVKISSSRLVSWIVRNFREREFAKRKDRILREHFNSKKYLEKLALQTSEEEDLEIILRTTLKRIRPAKKARVRGKSGPKTEV